MDQVQEFDINQFEQSAYSGEFEVALKQLLFFFRAMELRQISLSLNDENADFDELTESYMTRVAAATTALFINPKMQLSEQGLELFLVFKKHLETVFYATSFAHTEHILSHFGQSTGDGKFTLTSKQEIYKYLTIATNASAPPEILNILSGLPLGLRLMMWNSHVSVDFSITPKSEAVRETILKGLDMLIPEDVDYEQIKVTIIERFVAVYMYVSYFSYEGKHEPKAHLNRLMHGWCLSQGAKEPRLPEKRIIKEKPKILVISELFTSAHAMYRCYSPSLLQLKEKFHLVVLIQKGAYDDQAVSLFDEVHVIGESDETKIRKTIGKIIKINPDIIYYPSLGMKTWSVLASQFRLAPIQLMSLGHPATSMNPLIDYMITEEGYLGNPECFSEKIVLTENSSFKFIPWAKSKIDLPEVSLKKHASNDKVIRIAVPSSSYKLNRTFIDMCKDITERATRKIEFYFMPSREAFVASAIQVRLRRELPCKVFPYMKYVDYMGLLRECDIKLSPFPFGNTNGFVDAIQVGLPVVCLDGEEAHSHIDTELSTRLGMPDFCRTKTIEEYICAVLWLIENDQERVALSNELLQSDRLKVLYEYQSEDASIDVCAAMGWIYNNHEKIQNDERKCWSVDDRRVSQFED